MPQFDATIKHLKEGIRSMTLSAAVKKTESKNASKIQALGEALGHAGENASAA